MLADPDSALAAALATGKEAVLMPDVWLGEATSVLWLQVRRGVLTAAEAQEALALLTAQVPPTPTAGLGLHAVALEIGVAIGHSPYDTVYLAFALAMGARAVVAADGAFVTAVRRHPDPVLAGMVLSLAEWGQPSPRAKPRPIRGATERGLGERLPWWGEREGDDARLVTVPETACLQKYFLLP